MKLVRLIAEGTTFAGSRWVQTNTASGYSASSASSDRRCLGYLSTQRPGCFHCNCCSARWCAVYIGL
jgi:hypothetical protein